MEIKLPSGKIDLNPRREIYVEPGRTLSIKLDIDADKSIKLHQAGNSGMCIFRPVVFVDIEPAQERPRGCLKILKGTLDQILYAEDEETVIGFVQKLPGERGFVDVYVDDAVIFDENGLPMRTQDLELKEIGTEVSVRGDLDEEGDFQADLVVLGQVLVLKGLVGDAVDENLQFPLAILPGQEIIGDVTVALSPESLLLTGCDQEVEPTYIQKDMLARVVGKYDATELLFQAIAAFLQPEQVAGTLRSIQTENGVKTITIQTDPDFSESTVKVIVPDDVPPMVEGDGIIPDELFQCAIGGEIRVVLDPNTQPGQDLTAIEVRVQPEAVMATVVAVSVYDRTILATDSQTNELSIAVRPEATILKSVEDSGGGVTDVPIPLSEIAYGDQITAYTIPNCNSTNPDYNHVAFIILAISPSP